MNFKDNKPIYMQIAERLCDEVLRNKYGEDERIPSVREYASLVEVNANTVMRTYDYLQSNEIIYNKRGIGYFVSAGAKKLILDLRKQSFMSDEIEYFFNQLHTLGVSSDELVRMYEEYCNKIK